MNAISFWRESCLATSEIKTTKKLDYAFHCGNAASKHIIVLGHGVTGNKDRPFLVALARALEAEGFNVMRVSFAGNGDSEGRFEDATITKEVEDLGSVLDALDGYAICYAGHSMGGAVGVLRASTDARIQHLISLAGHGRYKGICTARIWRCHPRCRQHVG